LGCVPLPPGVEIGTSVAAGRADVDVAARSLVDRLTGLGATHVCVGVGISNAEQVRSVTGYASGAIVGSHLVSALTTDGPEGVARATSELVAGLSDVKA
jgi:tryptophan synthase alpha chain